MPVPQTLIPRLEMAAEVVLNPAMRAMLLDKPGKPLHRHETSTPRPGPTEALIRIRACAVCRTDLHVIDGELENPKLPLIPGHEIVGTVADVGAEVDRLKPGQRVGVPWLGWSCGECVFCRSNRENLCDRAKFTGYTLDGGFAEYCLADHRFCFPLPDGYGDCEAAPLLCAGLIGYRSFQMAGDGERIGLYGFGAAAHILAQVARSQGRKVFAFTRPGDAAAQQLAVSVGACWAGDSDSPPPEPLDAAILFAPVGSLVPRALQSVVKGGQVVCGGIHMSDIPSFPYRILWGERSVRSVANLTRRDAEAFLGLAGRIPIRVTTVRYPLEHANDALDDLRGGKIGGAVVLTMD